MVLDLYSRLQDKQTTQFVEQGVEEQPRMSTRGNLIALTKELEQAEQQLYQINPGITGTTH